MNTNSRILGWLLMLSLMVGSASQISAQITVQTFHDSLENGLRDLDEPLVTGLTVTGYDDLGNAYPFVDDGSGTFSLSLVPSRMRVHVTGYNKELLQGIAGPTSIFFASDGDQIEVPVHIEGDLDLSSIAIIVPCYEKGAASNKTNSPGIVSFPYDVHGIAEHLHGFEQDPVMEATIAEVGSTWGIAYQRDQRRVFASSILKRHVDLGPEGVSAIYTLDFPEDGGDAKLSSFNLQGYKPSVGPEIDLGMIKREITDGRIDENTPYALSTAEKLVDRASYDVDAFDKVGKISYGDIDVTEDEKDLWIVNLNQRSLIKMDVSDSTLDVTASKLKHYPIDELQNLPDLHYRYVRCINTGGNKNTTGAEALTDANGIAWDRNKYERGGESDMRKFKVENAMNKAEHTTEPLVYQTWRKGREFSYNIPIPKEERYTVVLQFAEPWDIAEGDRLFDVSIEGKKVLNNLDVVKAAGGIHRAISYSFEVEAKGKTLDIDFEAEFGNAIFQAFINGIEVYGNSTMLSGVLRPWGLSFHNKKGYLGLISDASISQSRDHLNGWVMSFDPDNIEAGLTEEVAFPLKYPRERASQANEDGPSALRTSVWMPWVEDWESTHIPLDDELSEQEGLLCSYPQPLISDIDFTEDGSMIIEMMDRWAHQTGHLNYSTILGDKTFIIGYAAGDILKAFKEPDGYLLEKENYDDGVYYRKDDGPSYNGEFFYRDGFRAVKIAHHGELVTGGMGVLQGTNEVVTTVHNPIESDIERFIYAGAFTQGVHFYSTVDGDLTHSYTFVDQFHQGKANGLGDIQFALARAQGEVGNYVWCDANNNGIQDPAEAGIEGIELVLHDKENSLAVLDRTTTDIHGHYKFDYLRANHCYEIRIDLSQLTNRGLSGSIAPLQAGSDTTIDSDADPNMLPGFAVVMFCTDDQASNRHDLDFGFGGPPATDAMKILCEDPVTGCVDFTMADLDECVDTSGLNQVRYYPSFNDADSMQNEITAPILTVCNSDSIIYARVSNGDPRCFSIATVELIKFAQAGSPPVFNTATCPTVDFDAYSFLQEQGYQGNTTTTILSFDPSLAPTVSNPVSISSYPATLYFSDETGTPACTVLGVIVVDSLPAANVEAGLPGQVCGLDCIDLTSIGAAFNANGSSSTQAAWTTTGTGTFHPDNQFATARFYCPSQADMLAGGVTLDLAVTDDACGKLIADAVFMNILSNEPMFLDIASSDTIDCPNPFVEDPILNDTFPRCRLVTNCFDTITATVIDYETHVADCEEIVKHIIRTQRVSYRGVDYFCTDTIFVRGLDLTNVICPPEKDSVFCHTGYLVDENGHPSPLETGVPMNDTIPLWPAPPTACDVLIEYKDEVFDAECPAIIHRTWIIKDNCTGNEVICPQWIMIYDTLGPDLEKDLNKALVADSLDFPNIDKPIIFIPTNSHDCEAYTYLPPVYASDTCSDVKMVKAFIPEIGTAIFDYNPSTGQWESHKNFKIPRSQDPIPVFYEAFDHCHNVTRDTCYFYVKDLTNPVTVCDKGINVTLSDTTVWLAADIFDEGSWDNCGISMILARRSDWATACGVNLCDDIIPYCSTEHHDTLYCAALEEDKHVNPIEAHYVENLRWLCEDNTECSNLVIGGWWYDLLKYATLECIDHPYPVDDQYFRDLLTDPGLQCLSNGLSIADLCYKMGFEYEDNLPDFPGPLFSSSDEIGIDVVSQIGGGWGKEVPFCCEDACQEVKVELLAMDYWCNWSKCWTTVYVEDKTPPKVVSDLYDVSISCTSYKDFYEDAVLQAQDGNPELLDSLLGGYDKVGSDRYHNLPPKTAYDIYDVACDSVLVSKDSLVYDEHHGYIWKNFSYYRAVYDTIISAKYRGQIADDCGLVCIEDAPWINIDHCGNGFIKRTFKFVGQCHQEGSTHVADTIVKHQTIWIRSDCDLSQSMFELPGDQLLYECTFDYDPSGSGNAGGSAHPDQTGWPQYIFDDDCKEIGIGYYDKVFKIVGGDQGCYKIVRTWCIADWCYLDGYPQKENWWLDDRYKGQYFSYEQKIILFDTLPPVCTINLPDTITPASCELNLKTEVSVEDNCGLLNYHWKLINSDNQIWTSSAGEANVANSEVISIEAEQVPPGTYTLKVEIRDECQNEGYCEKTFVIAQGKKPAPICLTSATLELNPMDSDGDGQIDTAMGTIWAHEFDVSSRPACGSDPDQLEFRIGLPDDTTGLLPEATSLTFGCDDIGNAIVRMYVLDETGTWDYCDVILVIQDNNGICTEPEVEPEIGKLSGILFTESKQIVRNAEVWLTDEAGQIIDSDVRKFGAYEFELETGSRAYVKPLKDIDHLNGVSTRDMIAIQKHILGREKLPTWFLEQAADVNQDGRISARDLLELRRLILGRTDRFAESTSWRFYDLATRSEKYHINPMQSLMRVDFMGVKIGDVNLDNNPALKAPRAAHSLVLQTEDRLLNRGERLIIRLRSATQHILEGYQFTLNYDQDKIRIEQIEGSTGDLGHEAVYLDEDQGMATVSWYDPQLHSLDIGKDENFLILNIEVLESGKLSDLITINSKRTPAEAYDQYGQDLDIALTFDTGTEAEFTLYQNRPNPFSDYTYIAFDLPRASDVTLTITDVTGKTVKTQRAFAAKGHHEWLIDRLDLPSSGILYYTLQASEKSAVKKMILMAR